MVTKLGNEGLFFVYLKDYAQRRPEVDLINLHEPRSTDANYMGYVWLWASVRDTFCVMMMKNTSSQNSPCEIIAALKDNFVCCVESDYLYCSKWRKTQKTKFLVKHVPYRHNKGWLCIRKCLKILPILECYELQIIVK